MIGLETDRLSGPALRTFENIADRWKLRPAERRALLGNVPATTYDRMRKTPDRAGLSADTLERISHVLGIYKALHVLIPNAEYADRWISEPNTAFGGMTARERMLESFTQLVNVRRYVDGARG
ncbi:MAG: MbcA/ParS/Xre antitoxin family protein [Candidatus Velthaea sp.]